MTSSMKIAILYATLSFVLIPTTVLANFSYSQWIHEIIQNGADLEITVPVFDETTETNYLGQPLPGFEAAYTLDRWDRDSESTHIVFENRVFKPGEADEITEYTCQRMAMGDGANIETN
jgi:hypothetical protein